MTRISEVQFIFLAAIKLAVFEVMSDVFKCFPAQWILALHFSSYDKFGKTLEEIIVAQSADFMLYFLVTSCNICQQCHLYHQMPPFSFKNA
jgi:hypothetical protein